MRLQAIVNTCLICCGVVVALAACGDDDGGSSGGGQGGSAGTGGAAGSSGTGGSKAGSGGASGSGGTSTAGSGGQAGTAGGPGDGGMGGANGGEGGATAGGEGGATTGGAGGDAGANGSSGGTAGTSGSGGSGGGAPMCSGSAESCAEQLTSADCADQIGCSVSGRCTGGTGCQDHTDESSCADDGCTWHTPCKSLTSDCSTLPASAPCNLQHGCVWNPSAGASGECEPNPNVTPCREILSQASCTAATGCNWTQVDMVCRGTATACGSLNAAECAGQDGCSLQ
jgi:hypothetical protein